MNPQSKEYCFFQHTRCEYFPCHRSIDPEEFNCLFCYCPLYALGDACGGNFKIEKSGIKNCTDCTFPHKRENYSAVLAKLKVLINTVKQDNLNKGRCSGEDTK